MGSEGTLDLTHCVIHVNPPLADLHVLETRLNMVTVWKVQKVGHCHELVVKSFQRRDSLVCINRQHFL